MAKIKKINNTKCCQSCRIIGTSLLLADVLDDITTLEKWQFLIKLNLHVQQYELAIPLLCIYPRVMKTHGYKNICTNFL